MKVALKLIMAVVLLPVAAAVGLVVGMSFGVVFDAPQNYVEALGYAGSGAFVIEAVHQLFDF